MTNYRQWAETAYPIIHAAYQANKNYGVREEWLAGLIAVECASLNPKAKRFEAGVFKEVMKVRKNGVSFAFPGFSTGKLRAFILNPSIKDDDLIPLATSYGVGQIMGYQYLNRWGVLPCVFENLTMHDSVMFTLRMMAEGVGWAQKFIIVQLSPQPWDRFYEFVLRWWNTGQVLGKTYDPDYVAHATEAMEAYMEVMQRYG